jgi:hypothetical protein
MKYIIFYTLMLLITWTLSCSGRAGKISEKGVSQAVVSGEEATPKLIKLIAPEENAG